MLDIKQQNERLIKRHMKLVRDEGIITEFIDRMNFRTKRERSLAKQARVRARQMHNLKKGVD